MVNTHYTRSLKGALGLRDPPLLAYSSNYNPTSDSDIWNRELRQFSDNNARSRILQRLSTVFGNERQIAQRKKNGGGWSREADDPTVRVKSELDSLNQKCTAKHSGTDCPFVRNIEDYYKPVQQSYTTRMSILKLKESFHTYKELEEFNVDMNLAIEDHMNRFTSQVVTTAATTCKAEKRYEAAEQSEPHPDDVQFANKCIAVGVLMGKTVADLVSGAESVIGSSHSTRDW